MESQNWFTELERVSEPWKWVKTIDTLPNPSHGSQRRFKWLKKHLRPSFFPGLIFNKWFCFEFIGIVSKSAPSAWTHSKPWSAYREVTNSSKFEHDSEAWKKLDVSAQNVTLSCSGALIWRLVTQRRGKYLMQLLNYFWVNLYNLHHTMLDMKRQPVIFRIKRNYATP